MSKKGELESRSPQPYIKVAKPAVLGFNQLKKKMSEQPEQQQPVDMKYTEA